MLFVAKLLGLVRISMGTGCPCLNLLFGAGDLLAVAAAVRRLCRQGLLGHLKIALRAHVSLTDMPGSVGTMPGSGHFAQFAAPKFFKELRHCILEVYGT